MSQSSPYFTTALADLSTLDKDIAQRITEVEAKSGFIPNVFLKLALRPDEFRAFFAYHDALMLRDSGLSKKEREMIVVVTSAKNNCLYCVIAHGAILRIYSKDPTISDAVAINYRLAPLSQREVAICEFALKVADNADQITTDDYALLTEIGLSDDDIWDIGAITAFFALSNRLAGFTQMKPNEAFYTMGRSFTKKD
ncbi:peroxidase-related enzyme [Acidithrix ferrooxidans]|uniref:Carboxymuconolactone decarboxylase family protein n=1 Tax=Acidithrix ferrooxidans TaxID=1280514 RepID=A0A0D8HII7_9ACTN|nr:peroxidase-related enzyme [Acidithrix ferrooxidans]KJF17674.1 carboxymuconolactone decarboxylase family protein [Acidithrix ferrooxidans]